VCLFGLDDTFYFVSEPMLNGINLLWSFFWAFDLVFFHLLEIVLISKHEKFGVLETLSIISMYKH